MKKFSNFNPVLDEKLEVISVWVSEKYYGRINYGVIYLIYDTEIEGFYQKFDNIEAISLN